MTQQFGLANIEAASFTSPQEQEPLLLLHILVYPNGNIREFEYDDTGRLRGINNGDGTLWLLSDEGKWFVLSEDPNRDEHVPSNINLNQDSGELRYETKTMIITERPDGERICQQR